MKLCYQVATPDVAVSPLVTAYQGSLQETFSALAAIGYDGVELMTLNPDRLDAAEVKATAEQHGLVIPLVCTGEVFGQLGLSFTSPNEKSRAMAISRVKGIIDFAAQLGANINIGRVRGQYCEGVPADTTYQWAVQAFREISRHAAAKNVQVALEAVTIMQTNFINTIAEAAKMVNDVAEENFRLMMDVFHLNIEEKSLLRTIREYSGYNIHVHLADNNRRYPGHCGMDFREILTTFYKAGYNGAFCTEIFQIPNQKCAARGAMAHLGPLFQEIYGRPYGEEEHS